MASNNFWFTYCFYAASAVIGSTSAVFLTAAFFWALVRAILGHFHLSKNVDLRIIAALFALYPLAELASVVVNGRGVAGLLASSGAILSFAILPVTSRLMLSSPPTITNSAGRGGAMCAVILLVFCVIQMVFLGFDRPEAGSGNASVLAFFALVLLCLCLSLYSVIEDKYQRLLIVGAICSLGAIVLSSTRAVWFATVVIVFISFSKDRRIYSDIFARISWFSKGAAILIALLTVAFLILPRIQFTLDSLIGGRNISTDVSISQRAIMWRGGWEQFKAAPFFGYGPDSVRETMAALGGDTPMGYSHYHNVFLTAAVRGGAIEALSILLIFGGLIWIGLKKSDNPYQRAGRMLILTTAVTGLISGLTNLLFTHDITNAVFLYTVIVGLALINAKPAPLPEPQG